MVFLISDDTVFFNFLSLSFFFVNRALLELSNEHILLIEHIRFVK